MKCFMQIIKEELLQCIFILWKSHLYLPGNSLKNINLFLSRIELPMDTLWQWLQALISPNESILQVSLVLLEATILFLELDLLAVLERPAALSSQLCIGMALVWHSCSCDQESCLTEVWAQASVHSHGHYPVACIRKGYVIASDFIEYSVTNNIYQTSDFWSNQCGSLKTIKNILFVVWGWGGPKPESCI